MELVLCFADTDRMTVRAFIITPTNRNIIIFDKMLTNFICLVFDESKVGTNTVNK